MACKLTEILNQLKRKFGKYGPIKTNRKMYWNICELQMTTDREEWCNVLLY